MLIYLVVTTLALFLLAVLVLRFVQPEAIYTLREQLVEVGINRVVLEQEASVGRNHNIRYNELRLKALRYETLGHTAEYALERAGKIRELYSGMDSKRAREMPDLGSDLRPQVCIIELGNLLRNMGEHLQPTEDYDYKTIKADAILSFIAREMSEEAGGDAADETPPHRPDEVVNWFQAKPMSIEQTIEILLCAVHGLAYRLRVQNPPPSPVAGSVFADSGGRAGSNEGGTRRPARPDSAPSATAAPSERSQVAHVVGDGKADEPAVVDGEARDAAVGGGEPDGLQVRRVEGAHEVEREDADGAGV